MAALADDLDTPAAVVVLNELANRAENPRSGAGARREAAATLHDLATRILGLRLGADE